MQELTRSITKLTAYNELWDGLSSGATPAMAVGLAPVHRAQLAAALREETGRPVLVLTADDTAAQRLAADLTGFLERQVTVLPARELSMAGLESMSHQFEHARIAALAELRKTPVAVASVAAVLQRTLSPSALKNAALLLKPGMEVSLDELTRKLTAAGYQRCVQVEGPGQFSIRGGILDLYPPQSPAPVRVEFWGDEIDTMSRFDVGSQRRGSAVAELNCLPCMETLPGLAPKGVEGLCKQLEALANSRRKKQHADLPRNLMRDIERLRETASLPAADKYLPLIYPEGATALDYLPADTIIVLDDSPSVRDAAQGCTARLTADLQSLTERGELPQEPIGFALDFDALCVELNRRTLVRADAFLNSIPPIAPRTLVNFTAVRTNPFGGSAAMAASDVSALVRQGKAVCVLCSSELRCRNMQDELRHQSIDAPVTDTLPREGRVHILEGALSSGFEYPELNLVVLVEGQTNAPRRRSRSKKSNRDHVKSYTDLIPGDLVVHEHHGIGRFVGMERITVSGAERDFVRIAFAGTDTLFVPATSLDLISKYIGGGEPDKVRLNKLGGAEWQKARAKARAAVKALATDLVALYAERSRRKGFAFPADDVWQREFEQSFLHEETEDQLRCVNEIKADMQSERPMDRLLCGDVGFGKTEVALRAVMKCILAGKQAAILVPTTVLA
ncbi:MAG: transcription-repair coupling factor, partial [Butyricicoccus sp.]|nr:transcription-repair coupling factor [Butyricicoccus sp.]